MRRPDLRMMAVTVLAFVILQSLFLTPVWGLQNAGAAVTGEMNGRLSIAAVALSSWIPAVAVIQLVMLVLPERWDRFLGRDGFADPFGWVAVALTVLLASSQASGVAVAWQAMRLIAPGEPAKTTVVMSLLAGSMGVVAVGWLIERFGLGRGFWIVLAAVTAGDLAGNVIRFATLSESGLQQLLVLLMAGGAIVALTVMLTLAVVRKGGRMEIVAWPLLLAPVVVGFVLGVLVPAFVGYQPGTNRVPDIVFAVLPLTLLLLFALVYGLLPRAQRPQLLVPCAGVLGLIAAVDLVMPAMTFLWWFPVPVGSLVVTSALLTALWWEQVDDAPRLDGNPASAQRD
jgi:hypothetical protein